MTAVYAVCVEPLKDEKLFSAAYRAASAERRKKADLFRFEKDKRLSLGAALLLDSGLKKAGYSDADIVYGEQGKPYIKNGNLFFGISHSEEYALCVFSDCEVGCDIEKMKPADIKIAKRFFAPCEYENIASRETEKERTDLFYEYWTLKESFMKATGLGMKLALNGFEIVRGDKISVNQSVDGREYSFMLFDEIDGYKCALCRAGEPETCRLEMIDIAGLLR